MREVPNSDFKIQKFRNTHQLVDHTNVNVLNAIEPHTQNGKNGKLYIMFILPQ